MDDHHERGSYRRHLAAVGFVAVGALLMSTGTAQADPSLDEVKDEVEQLEEDYASLADEYNQAKEEHDAAQEKLEDIESKQEDAQEELDTMQEDVRTLANAAYSGVDYTSPAYLISSDGPQDALEQASDLGYLSENQQENLRSYLERKEELDDLKSEAEETEEEAKEKLDEAESAKEDAEEKLEEKEDLLDELTAEQQEEVGGGSGNSSSASYTGSASGDAGAALDFAYAQIGDSYQLGANGPDVWDCSSLTQHAWKQAGVNLPRTTYDQINAGQSVSWSEKQPGDLLFFYDGPSHVGIYAGDGKMVHASNPEKPVQEVQLDGYYERNQTGVVRP
ncbi:NlpC/P60 family protein [Haloactinospora alba]|uniref:NlpC/P60 family protein n=1 Tax=Haloactinospora alba TaxID=405555 RepID=A0A543NJM5_9ACTN|nr:C40 family peptidase [Haloactinospora alba]TQN32017.1 NlpC/P60 family protein [Haloactinospora alba]